MTGLALIATLAVGVTAGWIAEQVLRRRANGLFVNMLVGAIGAVLAGALCRALAPSPDAWLGALVSSLFGAGLLLFAIAVARRGAG